MMELDNTELSNILPSSLTRDAHILHAASAVSAVMNETSKETVNDFVMSKIDILPEAVINSLAWQFHADTYDMNLGIEQKRQLVKNAIKDHKYKGTSWAVKSVVEVLLNYAKVEEWFNYGGKPYHFRVNGSYGEIVRDGDLQNLVDAIQQAKNVRSWLDGISFERKQTVKKQLAIPIVIFKEVRIGLPKVGSQQAAVGKKQSIPISIFKEVKVHG